MDFYLILGLDREASSREVQRAYTRLARRYHPDINPGDHEAEAVYRQATEAFETLSDPDLRQSYDTHGRRTRPRAGGSVEFHGFDFSTPVTGASVTFGELFSDEFRGDQDGNPTEFERGSDLFGEVELSFEEALRGAERKLTVTRLDRCAACDGSGVRRAPETRCAHCQGEGTRRWRRGHMVFSKPCRHCRGAGRLRQRPCPACDADGIVSRSDDIAIHVPPGVADGARMKVPAKGNAGRRGGAVGDLYITAKVEDHRWFVRDGDNLYLELPIAVHEAVLGAVVDVPTVDGPTRLRIPPGTQSGQRLRLKGRGAPSPRTGERGDLIVTVTLVLPRVADERSKALLEEFGRLNAHDVRRDLFGE